MVLNITTLVEGSFCKRYFSATLIEYDKSWNETHPQTSPELYSIETIPNFPIHFADIWYFVVQYCDLLSWWFTSEAWFPSFFTAIKTPCKINNQKFYWLTFVVSMAQPEILSNPFNFALELWSNPTAIKAATNINAASIDTPLKLSWVSSLTTISISCLQLSDPTSFFVV